MLLEDGSGSSWAVFMMAMVVLVTWLRRRS
jgi:MYXO-CTERM domain-containing protein